MNNKYVKDLILLLGVIIFCAIAARHLAGHETLEDYANSHSSEKTQENTASSASSEESTDVSESSSSSYAATDKALLSATESSTESVNSDVTLAQDRPYDKDVYDTRVMYSEGFYYEDIPDSIVSKITDVSYPHDCKIPLDDLRYCVINYVDFDGATQIGEMICNKAIADDVMEIFHELYENDYQIESIKLIDEFGADDNTSMEANNTSCFNYRPIGNGHKLSKHAQGLAIDINPLYNPQIKYKNGKTIIAPAVSSEYADRSASFPYKIDKEDLAYKLFKEHGFTWGGNWNSSKDYQHFEKKTY